MEIEAIVDVLNYRGSRNYVHAADLGADRENGFLYRRARQECGLVGSYVLRGATTPSQSARTPIVYLCRVDSEEQARVVHRRVWNQDIVPFLLVVSPRAVRVYRGFRFDQSEMRTDDVNAGALRAFEDLNRIASDLAPFRAEAIDSGQVWKDWARELSPETRVDWRLLGNLRDLGRSLTDDGVNDRALVHGIIGKFVYLRYLRDRDILSDRKLQVWDLKEDQVFSRTLSLRHFEQLLAHLDEWLNGSVFPLTSDQLHQVGEDRLRTVAGMFRGDAATGQMALEFANYDFSFIPIETLSVIYEQFLHAPDPETGISKGKDAGAYYTPVPLANFMLDRLESRRPLQPGMRVLDPACGSGVFLVQCYRRLIEQQMRKNRGQPPRLTELRALLTEHIFGMDTDADACQIAELSLVLTLLDYVNPPDLESTQGRRFTLPALREQNVVHRNAFAATAAPPPESFDWVVGNPPWKELGPRSRDNRDTALKVWSEKNRISRPTGGHQVAELFAWRSLELLSEDGAASLLIPAMTLFKYESRKFRQGFFADALVWEVANFANLAGVLFGGRSTVPAAVLSFARPSPPVEKGDIEVYAPFLANQPVLYDARTREKQPEVWSVIVNAGEVRTVRYADALSGDSLPWKLASWGSYLDRQLLERVSRDFPRIADLEKRGLVVVSEGFQPRKRAQLGTDKLEYHPELMGKRKLLIGRLKERRYLWRLPDQAIGRVTEDEAYVRLRGGFSQPLRVCSPPHVVVAASRAFAIYEEQFLIVPPRQIGIGSAPENSSVLKALALYLNSDFALYHQFLTSSQAGVQKTISTQRELKSLPIPFDGNPDILGQWVELYDEIIASSRASDDFGGSPLVRSLNELVNQAFELDTRSQALVHDLIHVRLDLTRGKVGPRATDPPQRDEVELYATMLRDELDGFLGPDMPDRHRIRIAFGDTAAAVEILLIRNTTPPQPISVQQASNSLSVELALARTKVRQQFAQWFYFDRNLRILDGPVTYVCKPMQRMHWTQTQAMLDAGDIIADTIASPAEDTAARV